MNDLEKMELMKQAWKEIFEVEDVPDDADFFEDGGDSIKAVQLSSWLLQKGLKLDLGKIFYTPVLSQMAETLEETDPVYVPDELVTKELVGSKINNIMKNMNSKGEPAPAATPVQNEQVCDPDAMPSKAVQKGNEQICDPDSMPSKLQKGNEQICDPDSMPSKLQKGNEQICDPDSMPQKGGYPGIGQNFAAQFMPQRGFAWQANDPEFTMMITMFQTLLQQQQVMLQMMQVMLTRMTPPVQSFFPGFPTQKPKKMKPHIPEEAKEALRKQMEKYQTHTVEKPIEKPNVIGIKPAKVTKPEYSAEEVLDHVLSGILKNGYSKTKDLFEQGLTSLDTVKMVTRCGEHGYSLSMQDIYMKSTFEELVKCMKPGE